MNQRIHTFRNADRIAEALAGQVLDMLKDAQANGRGFHMALSGGSATRILASRPALLNRDPELWGRAELYWVDERCVPPDHADSNYRLAREILLDRVSLEGKRIYRIKGEDPPGMEALRYADIIRRQVPLKNGIPCFDLILLGMGSDGHTASIFPDQMQLIESDRLCEVATHPASGQKRITMTGKVINNANHICFLVTGKEKGRMLANVLGTGKNPAVVPAGCIRPVHGTLDWFTDLTV